MRQENQEAIALLDEWFSEPDEMGEAFWDEYEQDLSRAATDIQIYEK